METPSSSTTRIIIIAGVTAFLLVVVFVIWNYGAMGFWYLAQKIAMWSLIIAALGLVVWVVIWLFKSKSIDLVAVHKDRIIEACKIGRVPFKQGLSFRPSGDDWVLREVGTVIGACQIKSQPRKVYTKEPGKLKPEVPGAPFEDMIFIAFRPPGVIGALFASVLGSVNIVGGPPEDFSSLGGEVIYMKGVSFGPKLYEIFFLAHHWEDRHRIDETVKENVYRMGIHENLKELATMMEDAIDASPKHKKEQEMRNIQTLNPSQAQPGAPR